MPLSHESVRKLAAMSPEQVHDLAASCEVDHPELAAHLHQAADQHAARKVAAAPGAVPPWLQTLLAALGPALLQVLQQLLNPPTPAPTPAH